MGLASALSTALTGLNAAESTISVAGNNVANANTIGFKASNVQFATQFSQTLSLGSAPTQNQGGTNPRQVGLGTKVAAITPDFGQGTLQISNSPSDLAIQGAGFFIVDGGQGEHFFSRNGQFTTNSSNELVTGTGQRLLGFGINSSFQIQNTALVPISIPFGAAAVAQPTSNVTLGGTLSSEGDIATLPSIIQSAVFSDGSIEVPVNTTTTIGLGQPSTVGITSAAAGAGAIPAGQYVYKFAYVTSGGLEAPPSNAFGAITTTGTAGVDQAVSLTNIPAIPPGFTSINVYRADNAGAGPFALVGSTANPAVPFVDTVAAGTTALDTSSLAAGSYKYYVTFFDSQNNQESRPTALIGPQNVGPSGRIELNNLPVPSVGSNFDQIRIYRNSLADDGSFRLVTTNGLTAGTTTYIDKSSDALIAGNSLININGPAIAFQTLLADAVNYNGTNYVHIFNPNYDPNQPNNGFLPSVLSFTGEKGADGTKLSTKQLAISNTTTVQDLINFITQATGIQNSSADPLNPITGSPGGTILNSRLQFTSNLGKESAVGIGIDAFQLVTNGQTTLVTMGFDETQAADGESAKVDFLVFNSLGEKLNVRVTTVKETKTGAATTWRWFADSSDNNPQTGVNIAVGTGEFTFDANGHFATVTNDRVSISENLGTSSLPFTIDFSSISGLSAPSSTMFLSKSDGSAPGTLAGFTIAEDGRISGQFSNGVSRDLGQIRLARFANASGLESKGQNLYAQGVNSGVAIEANPGFLGLGTLVAGAVEESNTDIGQNLIDLITASTQYRGGARVITTVQQLLDELLNLRR